MKNKISLVSVFLVSSLISSQSIYADIDHKPRFDTTHTAENSLDWFGEYTGTQPCKHCQGIQTSLILKENKTFQLKETYLYAHGRNKTMISKGHFKFNTDHSSIITLNFRGKKRLFFIGEHTATPLNIKGKNIKGAVTLKQKI